MLRVFCGYRCLSEFCLRIHDVYFTAGIVFVHGADRLCSCVTEVGPSCRLFANNQRQTLSPGRRSEC